MDPISLIIAALTAGAGHAGAAVVQQATKDAYERLKALVMRRFGGDPEKRRVLENFEADPTGPTEALARTLAESGLEQDAETVRVARALLERRDPEGAAKGIYTVQVGGNVEGLVQGDHNTVTFTGEPKGR